MLDDDGFVLAECNAIIAYLAKKYGGGVVPANEKEEALIKQWGLYYASSIDCPLGTIQKACTERWAQTERGKTAIADAFSRLNNPLKVVERYPENSANTIGNRFTAADITAADIIVAETLRPINNMTDLLAERSTLNNWLAACQARLAFKVVWDARSAEPA